jgi:hypothetical protein
MTLKFSPSNHSYWLDKKRVPGVTTLIGKGLPKDGLPYWSARTVAEYVADNPETVESLRAMGREPMVGALKGVPWQARDSAGARGTEVHAIAEQVVHGIDVSVPEHLAGHVQGYVDWLDAFKVVPVLTERSVGNRAQWYAGRFDLIADMAGCRWMLDVKTSKSVYGATALQVDAYRNAEFYVNDDDPDTEHSLPEDIERLGVMHVTEHGTTLYPLDSSGKPFKDFLHCAYIAKRRDAIEAYLLDPATSLTELENLR